MKLIRAALVSFFIAAMTFFPTELVPADANLTAAADNSAGALSVSSATFVVYATKSATEANPAGTALVLSRTSAAQYFYVRNTGDVSVAQFTIVINYDAGPGPVTIDRCNVGVVFTALNTCASSTKTAMTISNSVMNLAIAPNTWYQFELDPKKTVTPTISVSVSSSQIRTPLITNS